MKFYETFFSLQLIWRHLCIILSTLCLGMNHSSKCSHSNQKSQNTCSRHGLESNIRQDFDIRCLCSILEEHENNCFISSLSTHVYYKKI